MTDWGDHAGCASRAALVGLVWVLLDAQDEVEVWPDKAQRMIRSVQLELIHLVRCNDPGCARKIHHLDEVPALP